MLLENCEIFNAESPLTFFFKIKFDLVEYVEHLTRSQVNEEVDRNIQFRSMISERDSPVPDVIIKSIKKNISKCLASFKTS